jgi:DNA invertase Pin-like site-specific DNA recombinase
MLGVFAEFETSLRKERQMEGIPKAKSEGKFKGRPPSIDKNPILELKLSGMTPTQIAKEMRISRVSVYRGLS